MLHLLPTGLSPLRNAVSQYGISRYRSGYRVQTLSMGVAAIASAIGIAKLNLAGSSIAVILLLICGAARCAISWFPMDTPGTERTETGRRHGLLAIAAFAAVALAAIRLGTLLNRADVWRSTSAVVVGLGIEMLVTSIALGPVRRHETMRRYFGLVERAFYAGALAFFFIVSIELIRR
ncbi:MAG: DUF998 domain-containing protein [Acidimicrobiales bacterium]